MALCLFKCANTCGCRECLVSKLAFQPRKPGYRFQEIQELIDNQPNQEYNLPKIVSLPSYDQKNYALILKEGDNQSPLQQQQQNENGLRMQNENASTDQIFKQEPGLNLICFKVQNRFKNVICGYHIENLKYQSKIVIIHTHGNYTDIGYMIDQSMEISCNLNVNVVAYDYSGYGCSSGKPSEKSLIYDLESIYIYVLSLGYQPINIILYGQSIGSGPSTFLPSLSQYPIGGLIIHSGFTSGLRITQKKEKTMEKTHKSDVFPNIEFIKKVNAPILILHGDQDQQFKIHHANQLYDKTKKNYESFLVQVEGADHNNIENKEIFRKQYFKELRKFLKYLKENKRILKKNQENQEIGIQNQQNHNQQNNNILEIIDYTQGFPGDGWSSSFNHIYKQLFIPTDQNMIIRNNNNIDIELTSSSYAQQDQNDQRSHNQDQIEGFSVNSEQNFQSNLSQISQIAQIYSNQSQRLNIYKQPYQEDDFDEESKIDRSNQDHLSQIERDQEGSFLKYTDNQQQNSFKSFSIKSNYQSYQNSQNDSRDQNYRNQYQYEDIVRNKKSKYSEKKEENTFFNSNPERNLENYTELFQSTANLINKNLNTLGKNSNKQDINIKELQNNQISKSKINNSHNNKNNLQNSNEQLNQNKVLFKTNNQQQNNNISQSYFLQNSSTSHKKQISSNNELNFNSQTQLQFPSKDQSFHQSYMSQEINTQKKRNIKEGKNNKNKIDFENDDIRLFNISKFGRQQQNSILSSFILDNKNPHKSSEGSSSSFLKSQIYNQQLNQNNNIIKDTSKSLYSSENQPKSKQDDKNSKLFESKIISLLKSENKSSKYKQQQDQKNFNEKKSKLNFEKLNQTLNPNDVEQISVMQSKVDKERNQKPQQTLNKQQQLSKLIQFSKSKFMEKISSIISKQDNSLNLFNKSSKNYNASTQQQMQKQQQQKDLLYQQNSYDQPISKEDNLHSKGIFSDSSSSLGPSISIKQANAIQQSDKDSDNVDIQKKQLSQSNSSLQSKESFKSITSKV